MTESSDFQFPPLPINGGSSSLRFKDYGEWVITETGVFPVTATGELLHLFWNAFLRPQDEAGIFAARRDLILDLARRRVAAGDDDGVTLVGVSDYEG